MPALNKQSLINLLIDSPLREAIKINLIDIVNNTADADLDKTYSTISKELEIYQKATERRLKLAGETIAQLSGTAAPTEPAPAAEQPMTPPPAMPTSMPAQPPVDMPRPYEPPTSPQALDLPPLPPMPSMPPMPQAPAAPAVASSEGPVEVPKAPTTIDALPPLQVPPLDLPPLPTMPATSTVDGSLPPVAPQPQVDNDEAALQEIQKELDALKSSAASDIATSPSSLPPVQQM